MHINKYIHSLYLLIKLKIGEVYCKSILSRSSLYDIDYSINPYIGCEHGCKYCYSPFYVGYKFRSLPWGEYVYAKINAARILIRELKRNPSGSVLISSVTDPYQPLEEKFMITRRILEILLKSSLEIYILTKSPLVLRDIDILTGFKSIYVGFSITNLNEDLRVKFEPKAPSIDERLRALRVLCDSGIKTYVFIAPLMPFNEPYIYDLMDKLVEIGVDYAVVDKLNIHGDRADFIDNFTSFLPLDLRKSIKNLLLHDYHEYYNSMKVKLINYSREIGLNLLFSY